MSSALKMKKPVFKLASLGSGQLFTHVSPSPEVLQRVLSQANKANV